MGPEADPYQNRDDYLEYSNANSLVKFENSLKEQDEFLICTNISLKVLSFNEEIEDLETRNIYSKLDLFDHLSEKLTKNN
jgi:hypothetical protein